MDTKNATAASKMWYIEKKSRYFIRKVLNDDLQI